MPYTIKCAAESFASNNDDADDTVKQIEKIASEIFDECELRLSNFNPDSEVNIVNALSVEDVHIMSPALTDVILCSKELVKLTRGAFDPSCKPLLNHYENMAERSHSRENSRTFSNVSEGGNAADLETIRKQRLVVDYWRSLLDAGFSGDPSDSRVSRTVQQLLEIGQWKSAFSVGVVDDDSSFVKQYIIRKKHVDARLDLCGIAKGWAIDKIAEALPSPCWVEWGGDIKVTGKHPSGRPWVVAVPEPPKLTDLKKMVARAKKAGQVGPVFTLSDEHIKNEGENEEKGFDKEYLALIELRDGDAVTTSGDYEKVIERNGKLYSHVINPLFGRLLELNNTTLAQAVIVSKSCMAADALATAVISKGNPSEARAMLDHFRTGYRYPVRDYLLYSRQGPRIIRLSVPGVESKSDRKRRLQRHQDATVIVVGSGLAGMSAAIEAADARAHVSGRTDYSLVRTLSSKSADAIHWLKHNHGIPLIVLSQLGGHAAKRTHRAPPAANGAPVPIGWLITSTMRDKILTEYNGKIEIRLGMNVTKLMHDVDAKGVKTVTGVEVNSSEVIKADAVILCTGGFGCCQKEGGLMARFRPDLIGTATTNGHFAQGDGVLLGEEVGAELIDMRFVQLHPTGFLDKNDPSNPTKYLAPEAIRGSGGVLVNSEGKRFVNELDLRSVVAAAIQKNCSAYKGDDGYVGPPFAWCILSEEAQELFGKSVLAFYKDKLGLFDECEDVAAIAKLVGCQTEVLEATLQEYEKAASVGTCKLTHKSVFPSPITARSRKLVVARVTPSIHYTMGGININPSGEVQEKIESIVGSHRRIRNLFAAGEVTGGVHGGNRLGGNSLLECVVFGRIAGERAATIKQTDQYMFPGAKVKAVGSL